jgi:4-hydroxy-tetrahydrodipicolinate synthase
MAERGREARFTGVYSVLPTPFLPDESLDETAVGRLVACAAAAGVRGVTMLGVMGEAAKLTDDERRRVVAAAREHAAPGLDVVAGIAAGGERACLDQAELLVRAGAAAVMASPPPGTAAADAAAVYRRLAEAAGVPVVVQDLPSVSGVVLPAPLLADLASAVVGVAAIKLEDAPTPPKVSAIRRAWGESAPATLLGGLGGLYLLEELRRGASGTMTGFAFPEALVRIVDAAAAGDLEEAERVFERFLPVIRHENMPGLSLGIRKVLWKERGVLTADRLRLPAPFLDPDTRAEAVAYARRYLPMVAQLSAGAER